jgi:hypothetical protein
MSASQVSPSPAQHVSVLARVQGSLAKPRRLRRPGPALRAETRTLRGRRATGASGGGSRLQETDRVLAPFTAQAPTLNWPARGPKNGVHLTSRGPTCWR